MNPRFFVLALIIGLCGPAQGIAQTADTYGLRGSDDISDDYSDENRLIDSGGSTNQTGATSSGAQGADSSQSRRTAATPRRRPTTTTRRGSAIRSPEPVRPVQQGARNPDGTVRETTSSVQTATQPDDNFNDDAELYEPLGFRAGSFIVRSSIELTTGMSDNINRINGGRKGSFYRIRPNIDARSDWTRHQLNFTLRGGYDGYIDNVAQDEPSLESTLTGRIDVRDGTRIDLEGSYQYEVEDPSSAEVIPGFGNSGKHTLRGAAGVTQDIRRFEVTLNGTATREEYVDPRDRRRATAVTDDRDNTLTEISLRTGYRVTPAFKPFIKGSIFARQYDLERDTAGILRSSTGYSFSGGADVDLGPKLTSSLALGWRSEELRDRRFDPLEGLTVDGSLAWSPSRLTTVTLTAATSFDPTTIRTSPGSIQYDTTLAVSRSLRRNIKLDTAIGLSYRDYQGISLNEWRRTASAALAWSFNRNVAAVVRYSYEDLESSRKNSNYSSNAIELGLTLRH